jgi:hypothetical protein
MSALRWTTGLASLVAAFAVSAHAQQSAPACDRFDYVYEGPPGEWSAPRIALAPARFDAFPDDALRSPGLGYALWTENPDMRIAQPVRNSSVMAAGPGGRGLRLDLTEVRWGVEPVWLNEKLLYLRVVWGRIFYTDLILNAETAEAVYAMDVRWACVE